MRRLWLATFLAVFLLLAGSGAARANPIESWGFGCGGICIRMFPGLHQEGPLYNYGPYYGYYPFKPYGPWDAYLRYDPFFYGDPYAKWRSQESGGNMYGRNPNFPYLRGLMGGAGLGGGLGGGLFGGGFALPSLFHKHGCTSCGFWHASWLHGGWFRGHAWLHGGFGHGHKSGCSSCGGVAVTEPTLPANPVSRYSGFGDPSQSAVFYAGAPTLDPTADLPVTELPPVK